MIHDRMSKLTCLRMQERAVLLSMAVLTLTLVVYGAMPAYAQEPTPPPGDCFGGALSEDPLHRYVLEEADREEVIDVDARCTARVAHSSSTSLRPILWEMRSTTTYWGRLRRRTGEYECVLEPNGCGSGVFETGRGFILPPPQEYEDIQLKPGGADARRSEPGWASYHQLWPTAEGGSGDQVDFDVSDVDIINFPPVDCSKETHHAGLMRERYPGLGLAGWHGVGGVAYLQVKPPPGEEEKVAAATRKVLAERNPQLSQDNIVIIPVKYDFEDLGRWQLVLDRFAASSGNTIGIVQAEVGLNKGAFRGRVVYPLPEVPKVKDDPHTGSEDRTTLRETVWVWTLDLEKTVDALPQLLPQLNIPVDAVGVVAQVDVTPQGRPIPVVLKLPESLGGTAGSPTVTDAGSNTSLTVAVGGAAVLGALVVAGLAFLFVRKLRSPNRRSAE